MDERAFVRKICRLSAIPGCPTAGKGVCTRLLAALFRRCYTALSNCPERAGKEKKYEKSKAAKDKRTDYNQFYSDDYRTPYVDQYGCIPFYRSMSKEKLADVVDVRAELLEPESLRTLGDYYAMLRERGARVYVSCAVLNLDALPAGQAGTLGEAEAAFRRSIEGMEGVRLISAIEDYLVHSEDLYDTNYHLLSEPAKRNTALWLRDLLAAMAEDGLWEGDA